jgi:cation diffusion facilitator CzcD-associated flavoprotein CzcO
MAFDRQSFISAPRGAGMIVRSIEGKGCDAVVIGAGPYGLAVAAHLRARGVATRAFGQPMSFWRRNMPRGMKLRSPWGATDIADPAKALSLDAYVKGRGIARQEPLPVEVFVGYGDWFQSRAVPDLDRRMIARIEAAANGFVVTAADGEIVPARRVVIATGLAKQQFRPAAFATAPPELVTHTSDHDSFDGFRGKRVAVIGRGQSACETAALLGEAGAEPEIVCRGPIRWLDAGGEFASWRQALFTRLSAMLAAPSAVGPFPLNWLVEAPNLVRLLPDDLRAAFNAASLRPGVAGWLRPRFGGVRVTSGVEIIDAQPRGEAIEIKFADGSAAFDRIVLATGYKIDIARLGVLAPGLLSAIARRDGSPVLSGDSNRASRAFILSAPARFRASVR